MDKRFLLALARLKEQIEKSNKNQEEVNENIRKDYLKIEEDLIPDILKVIKEIELTPGPEGKQGPQGKPGKDGKDGKPGKDGKDGKPGKDGKDGKPGKDGLLGPRGLPGRDGKDGETPILKIGKVESAYSDEKPSVKLRNGEGNIIYLDFKIPRGERGIWGADGRDAKINGENVINLLEGNGIKIIQEGKNLTIHNTGGGGTGGTTDYELLDNLPQINGVTLRDNKKSSDLNLQDKMDTISNSDIEKLLANQI